MAPRVDDPAAVFLSRLTLDPAHPTTLHLLGDTYALHRWVLLGFPDDLSGGVGRVLFRAEAGRDRVSVLVQSEGPPDWGRMASPLCRADGPKPWRLRHENGTPLFVAGQTLRFRLRASPSKRKALARDDPQRGNVRVALTQRVDQCAWLARQGERLGFTLAPLPSGDDWFDPFAGEPEARAEVRITSLNLLRGRKADQTLRHYGVDFDGALQVTDPERFVDAICGGVGPGKGFGFGLLSVAPLR